MAKGKYADIVDKLPRSLGTDPAFQEKVNAVKRSILEPESDSVERKELSSEVLEELILDICAMQKVVNDALIRSVAGNRHASKLAQIYRDIRKMKGMFDQQEKTTNVLVEAYEQILIEQYEIEATTNVGLVDGGSVRIQYEPHGAVVDKDANREWAKKEGLENLLTLPWQTVNALTKAALLEGREPPDGVEATTRTKVVYTKG